MSASTRLRSDFKVAVDHIRDRVVSNVTEARRQGRFKMEDSEIQKLIRIVEMSFEQGFITSSAQIEKSIDEVTR